MSRTIVLASDHGGFALKQHLHAFLQRRGFVVVDVGTHSKESCDYPVFAQRAAEEVAAGRAWRGIVIDGAGIGSAMAANKVAGVRAGMAFNEKTAINAAEHNNANVLTLGAGYLSPGQAEGIVSTYLSRECTEARHLRRAGLIDAIGQADTPALVRAVLEVLSSQGAQSVCCTGCEGCQGRCVCECSPVVRQVLGDSPGRVSATLGVQGVPPDLARFIDHTLLAADTTAAQISQLCDEALEYGFASVCVNPHYVRRCAERLAGSQVKVCTVIGFPLGATPRQVKAMEARHALRDGARELDMVVNIGALKSGELDAVYQDIRLQVEVAHDHGALLKVILETALLTDEEKITACVLSRRAHADFVKTSTGFSTGGATLSDVQLMAAAVEHQLGVKASGGVRSAHDARQMIAAGATRIGASVGVKIAREASGLVVERTGGSRY